MTTASVHYAPTEPPEPVTDPALWTGVALLAFGCAVAVWHLGWTVRWGLVGRVAGAVGALAVVGHVYRSRWPRMARVAYGLAFFFAAIVLAQLTTFLNATLAFPLRDDWFGAVDRALGFDFPAVVAWLHAHPWLNTWAELSYTPLIPLSLVAVVVLAVWYPDHLTPYLRAYGIAFLVTASAAAIVPALGPAAGTEAVRVALALRDGSFHDLNPNTPAGIVCFPSFHAVGAVLVSLALWPTRLRWPVLALTGPMFVATIPIGGHYLTDVLAGTVLAFGAAWWMRMPAVIA